MEAAEKRGRGRPGGFKMPEEHRLKIKAGNLLNILNEHAEGKREMSATQVAAATVLLRKALPDLTAADVTTRTDNAKAEELTDDQLAARIASLESEDKDANHTEH